MSAAHVTYGMVKPRLDDEIEKLKDALCVCHADQVVVLQAKIEALRKVDQWFARSNTDTQIFDQTV